MSEEDKDKRLKATLARTQERLEASRALQDHSKDRLAKNVFDDRELLQALDEIRGVLPVLAAKERKEAVADSNVLLDMLDGIWKKTQSEVIHSEITDLRRAIKNILTSIISPKR